jgi:hypothetical protein
MAAAREAAAQHCEDKLYSAGVHARQIHRDVLRRRLVRPVPHLITFTPALAVRAPRESFVIVPTLGSAVEARSLIAYRGLVDVADHIAIWLHLVAGLFDRAVWDNCKCVHFDTQGRPNDG